MNDMYLKNMKTIQMELTNILSKNMKTIENVTERRNALSTQLQQLDSDLCQLRSTTENLTTLVDRISKVVGTLERKQAVADEAAARQEAEHVRRLQEEAATRRACEDRSYEGQRPYNYEGKKEEKHECKYKKPVVITLTGDDLRHAFDDVSLSDIFSSFFN